MAAIDAEAEDPVEVLIERAGTAVARSAEAMLGGVYGRRVAVIAGRGNNGRDGLLAGERLRARGASVTVYDARVRPDQLPPTDLVIDAAYGTGFHGDWVAPQVDAAAVLAVDIPSGIDGLTGEAASRVLRADTTVTFAALKPGLVIGEGPDYAGEVEVVDIGLDVSRARVFVVEGSDVAKWWRPRSRTAHKWSTAVRVVAGSPGMQGAGFLAAAAAQRTGAGMVQLVSPVPQPHAPVEAVTAPLPPYDWAQEALRELHRFHGMVLGPGLGRRDQTCVAIREVARRADVPLVIDGDGLYALSVGLDSATAIVQQRSQPTVLTPHDGEFALLTGHQPGPDRITAARQLARELRAVVLLKGPTTVVASSSGAVRLVNNADERLATAGSGDVLSGMIAALMARGLPALDAASAGAWLHGAAASHGPRHGLIAGDIPPLIPDAIGEVVT
jgi:NAD(P)H-hydrate epimerase